MHSFLKRQNLEYAIIVVNQTKGEIFNRGKLSNIGYVEGVKLYDWDCFVFHDVDLLPENSRNIYTCSDNPIHLTAAIDLSNYKYELFFCIFEQPFRIFVVLNTSHMIMDATPILYLFSTCIGAPLKFYFSFLESFR